MRAALLVILLVLAVSGCGDEEPPPPLSDEDFASLTPMDTDPTRPMDGSDSPNASTTAPEGVPPRAAKEARRTFETWLGAFAAGDGDRACPLQTPRFTQQQVKRLAQQDRIEPGASCGDLVEITGVLFEVFRLDVGEATVARAPSDPDEVAFSVAFKRFATLVYVMIDTKNGWRVDEDLTAS